MTNQLGTIVNGSFLRWALTLPMWRHARNLVSPFVFELYPRCRPQYLCLTWGPMRTALTFVLWTDKANATGTYAKRTRRAPDCTTPVAPWSQESMG